MSTPSQFNFCKTDNVTVKIYMELQRAKKNKVGKLASLNMKTCYNAMLIKTA